MALSFYKDIQIQLHNFVSQQTWPLWNICVTNDHRYIPLVVSTSQSFSHSWLITRFVTRLTRRVPLVEQELLTLPEHLSSPLVFSGVRVTRSLVLCVCFVDHCLSLCPFSFSHCVVCPSAIYWFWLFLWYLQTLLTEKKNPQLKLSLAWKVLEIIYQLK